MGNNVYYRSSSHLIGDVSKGRWEEMRRLLPELLRFLNERLEREWSHGRTLPQALSEGAYPGRPPVGLVPPAGKFVLTALIRDESATLDEIFIEDAAELARLFRWFEILSEFSGAASLYAPLVEQLRVCTQGITEVPRSSG